MQRKKELSFLNIIFCFLVIFIHVSSTPVSTLEKGSLEYCLFFLPWRLSAFVVQGFIFLSGLKMFLKKDSGGYIRYYWGRFKGIVIPYIVAVLIFYAYFWWRKYFEFSPKELLGYIFKGDLVSHFYFVIVIVQFYALKPFWKFMVEKISPKAAIPISLLIMLLSKRFLSGFLYNDRIFTTYLAYWTAGCYAGVHYDKVLTHIKKYRAIYISQFIIVALAEAIASYTGFVYKSVKFLEELHVIYCISAVMFTFSLADFGKKIMENKLLKKIDGASYYIYLIHPLFIFITDGLLKTFGVVGTASGFLIRCAVTYFMSLFVSVLYLDIKKSKLFCKSKR